MSDNSAISDLSTLRGLQHDAWQRGERLLVETLLGQSRDQPLAEDAVLELILSEYELRVKLADHPTVAEYVTRFPNLTQRLQRLFALHAALDQEPSVSAAVSGQALAAGSSVPNPPSHPDSSAAAVEKTRMYQAGDAADDEDDTDDSQPDLSFLLPSSKPGSIGVLGHYEVLSLIGQGAFGIVFKAFDESLHRVVAIKVMNPQLAATSPPRKRFLREARAAAAIRHDNIVQVYSVEEQPLPYLVMEFIDGQTLKQKLDGAGPLETSEVLHLGRQMAAGLAAAQAMGLIHRDIKPGNILIEEAEGQGLRAEGRGGSREHGAFSLAAQPSALGQPSQDHRLRHGSRRGRRQPDAYRNHLRHADVHGSRTSAGCEAGSSRRPVQSGERAVPDGLRPTSVSSTEHHRGPASSGRRHAASAARHPARDPRLARRDHHEAARQEPR